MSTQVIGTREVLIENDSDGVEPAVKPLCSGSALPLTEVLQAVRTEITGESSSSLRLLLQAYQGGSFKVCSI